MAYELRVQCGEFFDNDLSRQVVPDEFAHDEPMASTFVQDAAGFGVWYRWRCQNRNPCPFPLFHKRFPVDVLHVNRFEMAPPGSSYLLVIDRLTAQLEAAGPLTFIIPVVDADLAERLQVIEARHR